MKWCLFYLILNGFKKEKNKIKCIFAYMWFYGFLYKGKEYLGDKFDGFEGCWEKMCICVWLLDGKLNE